MIPSALLPSIKTNPRPRLSANRGCRRAAGDRWEGGLSSWRRRRRRRQDRRKPRLFLCHDFDCCCFASAGVRSQLGAFFSSSGASKSERPSRSSGGLCRLGWCALATQRAFGERRQRREQRGGGGGGDAGIYLPLGLVYEGGWSQADQLRLSGRQLEWMPGGILRLLQASGPSSLPLAPRFAFCRLFPRVTNCLFPPFCCFLSCLAATGRSHLL